MSGRVGRGESWQFCELASETQLCSKDRLIFLDRFQLNSISLQRFAWAMGSYNYSALGLYVSEHANVFVSQLHQLLPEAGVDSLADDVAAARVVSTSGPDFHRYREIFCRLADGELLSK